MFGLALHTSTPELGLAISDFDTINRYQAWFLGRDLSGKLHAILQEFLAPQRWQDIGFVVVCIGPGGFTSTRIGVATARTLAQQLELPLFGFSSLAAVAHHRLTKPEQQISELGEAKRSVTDIAVTMPAKRGAVYSAIYHWTGTTLLSKLEDTVLPAKDWDLRQAKWPQPLTQISLESGVGLAETTPSLLQLGYGQFKARQHSNWRKVTPFYGQHPVTV